MQKIIPEKLKRGDEIRVIAPARSMKMLGKGLMEIANQRLEKLGFNLTFGKHVNEQDDFVSSSIESRIDDLHDAFADNNVKGILTVIGGYNCNQLLGYIDWDLIKNNPKILCGYSDITALSHAIFAKTGLVGYSGPHYSTFGQKLHFDYSLEYFNKCLVSDKLFEVKSSKKWSDDHWYMDQENRQMVDNEGFWVLNEGEAEGTILGANLCTINLLQGTEFMPDLADSILFLEDDSASLQVDFDRNLQSLIHLPGFSGVRGLVIGRFQNDSKVTRDLLRKIVSKKELENMPVIGNVDFGHTDPKITFPVGGKASIRAGEKTKIQIIDH